MCYHSESLPFFFSLVPLLFSIITVYKDSLFRHLHLLYIHKIKTYCTTLQHSQSPPETPPSQQPRRHQSVRPLVLLVPMLFFNKAGAAITLRLGQIVIKHGRYACVPPEIVIVARVECSVYEGTAPVTRG
jgi:hypothetical protein